MYDVISSRRSSDRDLVRGRSFWQPRTCVASLSSHPGLCRDIDAVCVAQAISCPLLPVAPTVFTLREAIPGDCLAPKEIRQPLTRSELVQGVQPASTGRRCVFQHLPLWKAQALFLQASVVLMPSTLHAHKLWGAFLLHKQALLLQSEHLKTIVSFMGIRLFTALIISSHAHSLCDHDAHQSATSAHIHAAQATLLQQSEHLKTRVFIMRINLHTALIISSHAPSLCDHDTNGLPLELTVQPSLWLKIMSHDMVYLISQKSALGAYIIHMRNQPSCYFVRDTASHVAELAVTQLL